MGSEQNVDELGLLRDIRDQEIELMLSWRNAPRVRMNMYTRHEISPEEHRDWWQRVQRSDDKKYFMYDWGATPTGIVAFTSIDRDNSNSCWAFYASPEAPRGTGGRMEFLALQYAFEILGLRKLYCEVLAHNSAVIKLHKKFGFQVEGIFRQQHKMDAAFVDIYRLGILDDEWQALRVAMRAAVAAVPSK